MDIPFSLTSYLQWLNVTFIYITCEELEILSSQCTEAKELYDLKQSERESYQEMRYSLHHQLKLNEEAIAHFTHQINDIQQKKGNVLLNIANKNFIVFVLISSSNHII